MSRACMTGLDVTGAAMGVATTAAAWHSYLTPSLMIKIFAEPLASYCYRYLNICTLTTSIITIHHQGLHCTEGNICMTMHATQK